MKRSVTLRALLVTAVSFCPPLYMVLVAMVIAIVIINFTTSLDKFLPVDGGGCSGHYHSYN